MSPKCKLIWGEIVICSRKLNGEVFAFSKYHATTEIFLAKKLIIKENICLTPSYMSLFSIGLLEGFTHQVNLIFIDEDFDKSPVVAEAIAFLEAQRDIIFGITNAPQSGLLVRILGNKSEQLMDCLKTIANIFTTENSLCRTD